MRSAEEKPDNWREQMGLALAAASHSAGETVLKTDLEKYGVASATTTQDPELEELFAYFDQPAPVLPSPPEEDDVAAWVLDRLVAIESDRRPQMQAGGWDAETGEEDWGSC